MRRLAFAVVALAAVAVNGCNGPSESPTSPSQTTTSGIQLRSAGARDAAQLDASEAIGDDADGAEAAASVNLSGVWNGVGEGRGKKTDVEFDLKHTGKRITGKLIKPVMAGFMMTLALTESAVNGSKRTYKVSLTTTEKGGKCTPAKQAGTFVIDTAKKAITGTTTGNNTGCIKETISFNLKKK